MLPNFLLRALTAGIYFSFLIAIGVTTCASEPDAKPSDDSTRKFFTQHCQDCHAGVKPKGDFRWESLSTDFGDKKNRQRWLDVLEQVKTGSMPPAKKTRPPENECESLLRWIHEQASAAETAERAVQGRVVLRRLNRAEYTNTVRDLLGVNVDLKDLLPLDTSTNGFDNIAETLHVSSYLMDSYLEAADRVLDASIANRPRPDTINKRFSIKEERTVKPTGSVYRHVDDGVAIFSSWVSANIQVTLWQFRTRERGQYRFRISGYGFQTAKPITFHVMAGTLKAATEQYLIDYFTVPANLPTEVEFVEQLEADNTIRIVADGLGAIPTDVEKIGAENYKGPGLVVQWVEVEGPLLDSWPPKSHRLIFGDLPQMPASKGENAERREVSSQQPMVDADRILCDFTIRAFRRAVNDDDIRPFLARVKTKLEENYSFEQAMRVGLKAVLISPHFLFLRERANLPSEKTSQVEPARFSKLAKLDDFALASRISYFLWSSMPDDELFSLAKQNQLSQPDTLRRQVERMLRDPKSATFTENFVGQWLGLRAIDATSPDRMLYPEYDDVLKVAMVKEATLFFDEVLKQDLSLTNFVSSDFSMLNERLAKHYGIPGVEGLEFRKVKLPTDIHRGGVLTMAGVLKVTANGTTTSPILRGAWVLDRVLGTPPPKPPADVEAVEPDIRGATTIRNQLEKHRANSECASCHAIIDPPGFALENFDVIGGWREHYRSIGKGEPVMIDGKKKKYLHGPPVDAADALADGRRFQNIDEYKRLLLDDKDQLARALAEKLVSYATGATPTVADRPAIDRVVENLREQDYGFRALIHEIVQSNIFQSK